VLADQLKNIPLLANLTAADRQKLGASLRKVQFEHGDDIIVQGEAGKDFFLIESVRVFDLT